MKVQESQDNIFFVGYIITFPRFFFAFLIVFILKIWCTINTFKTIFKTPLDGRRIHAHFECIFVTNTEVWHSKNNITLQRESPTCGQFLFQLFFFFFFFKDQDLKISISAIKGCWQLRINQLLIIYTLWLGANPSHLSFNTFFFFFFFFF